MSRYDVASALIGIRPLSWDMPEPAKLTIKLTPRIPVTPLQTPPTLDHELVVLTAVLKPPYDKLPLTFAVPPKPFQGNFFVGTWTLSLEPDQAKLTSDTMLSTNHYLVGVEVHRATTMGEEGAVVSTAYIKLEAGQKEFILPHLSSLARENGVGDMIRLSLRRQLVTKITRSAPVSQITNSIDTYSSNDVLFLFRDGQQLWANVSQLRNASPYYELMFGSDFAETSKLYSAPHLARDLTTIEKGNKRSRDEVDEVDSTNLAKKTREDGVVRLGQSSEGGVGAESENCEDAEEYEEEIGHDFEDSDDDLPTRSPRISSPIHRINVKDAAYHTFRALLYYIATGTISFAPILSVFPRSSTDASSSSTATAASDSSLVPVSPKSIYRLADKLEMKALQALALANYQSQLLSQNLISELFSDLSVYFPEVKAVIMAACRLQWALVVNGEGMKELERQMSSGELIGEKAKLAFELMRGLR